MISERRKYLRVTDELPARVFNAAGEDLNTDIVELSLRGLKFVADERLLEHMQVMDGSGNAVFPQRFRIALDLSQEAATSRVILECRQIHKRRLSQYRYHIGAMILDLSEKSRKSLETYLAGRHSTPY